MSTPRDIEGRSVSPTAGSEIRYDVAHTLFSGVTAMIVVGLCLVNKPHLTRVPPARDTVERDAAAAVSANAQLC
ncbi:hypothetical protein [Nocardia sp. MW-W600-9]